MDPEIHPDEAVPLQQRNDGLSEEPGGSTAAQCTTVDVTTEPPKDHIIWSILSFVYCNFCCLGLAALICSINARDRKMAGDLEGARRHGSIACTLNIVATVLFSIFVTNCIVAIVLYVICYT